MDSGRHLIGRSTAIRQASDSPWLTPLRLTSATGSLVVGAVKPGNAAAPSTPAQAKGELPGEVRRERSLPLSVHGDRLIGERDVGSQIRAGPGRSPIYKRSTCLSRRNRSPCSRVCRGMVDPNWEHGVKVIEGQDMPLKTTNSASYCKPFPRVKAGLKPCLARKEGGG